MDGINYYVNGNGKYSPVIIHLPNYSANGHYVILVGKISSNVYLALDPWNSSSGAVWNLTINGNCVSYFKGTDTIDGIYQYYNSSGNIITDKEAPKISNVRITNVTSAGYKITCTVTDNIGITSVKFPTWTAKVVNGTDQDDLVWHEGSITGNTASYIVRISDHKNESGVYYTDIYAYDAAGNYAKSVNSVEVPTLSNNSNSNSSTGAQDSVNKLLTPNVKLSKVYTNKVTLTWKKVSSAAKYQIYYVANGVDKKIGTLKSGNTRTITGLKSGRSYTFKVKAVEGKESSDYATINVITRPDKVKLKSVSMNSQHKVKATWSSAYGADGYQYAISGNILFFSDKKYNATKCQGNVIRKDLKKGKRYYYRVRAYKKLGNAKYLGAWSNIKSFVAK